jgi:hypothetical protein
LDFVILKIRVCREEIKLEKENEIGNTVESQEKSAQGISGRRRGVWKAWRKKEGQGLGLRELVLSITIEGVMPC